MSFAESQYIINSVLAGLRSGGNGGGIPPKAGKINTIDISMVSTKVVGNTTLADTCTAVITGIAEDTIILGEVLSTPKRAHLAVTNFKDADFKYALNSTEVDLSGKFEFNGTFKVTNEEDLSRVAVMGIPLFFKVFIENANGIIEYEGVFKMVSVS